jgi:tetratricopeptide (TPR) repeat protein
MDTQDLIEESLGLLDSSVDAKQAGRRAKKLFKRLRTAKVSPVDTCDVYVAAFALSAVLDGARRHKLAIKAAQWAMSIECDSKNEAEYRYRVGTSYLDMPGREKEAVEELSKALELATPTEPLLPVMYTDAALAYARTGDDIRALEHLRRVLELLPEPQSDVHKRRRVQMARIAMAECYWRLDQDSDAMDVLKDLKESRNLEPGVLPMIYSLTGDIQAGRGDWAPAAENYRSAVEAAERDIDRWNQFPERQFRQENISDLQRLRKALVRDLRRCEQEIKRQQRKAARQGKPKSTT